MIFIYGNGGRAKLIKELLLRINKNYKFKFLKNIKISYFKIINKTLKTNKESKFYIGISDPDLQKKYYEKFKKKIIRIDQMPIIDPSSVIKSNVKIGKNTFILENSVIGPNVKIGNNVFIGSNSIINHDSKVGNFTTVGHGSNISGNVKIMSKCFIGVSSTIQQNINIGKNVVIGSASNIIKDCIANNIYYGNPGKKKINE